MTSNRNRMPIAVCLFVILACRTSAAIDGPSIPWSQIASPREQVLDHDAMTRFTISIDAQTDLTRLAAQHTVRLLDVPLTDEAPVTLDLQSAPAVFDANTVFLTHTATGEVRTPAPNVRCLRGRIAGDPNSSVFFTTSAVGVLATITKGDGRRWFLASERADASSVIIAREQELYANWRNVLGCAAPDLPREYSRMHPPRILSNELLEVELALETDSEFFTAAGSDLEKAQAYAIAMMSLVSDIYEKEIKVRVYVPWFMCWTTSPRDPYDAAGNPFTLRDKAIPYWQANRSDVKRDLYHMITSVSYGGGGFGYLSQLCQSPYGMASSSVQVQHTYPTYAFTYDVYIVAHELGHNFNAQHTHSCYFGYPLDTCVVDDAIKGGCLPAGTKTKPNPGSIMSYCGGPNGAAGLGYQMRMTFLPQNIALMRQSAESASCITAPPKPSVVLVSPRGSQAFKGGSPMTIEFLSTRVTAVGIDISLDGGRTWTTVLGDVDAARGSVQWTPPDTCSNSVMMRLRSTEDSTVSDVTTLPFAIYAEAPSGLLASYEFAGDYVNSVCGGFDNAMPVNGEVRFVADRFGLKDSAIAVNGAGYLVAPSADLTASALAVSLWCKPDSLTGKNTMIGTNYGPGTNVFEIYNWGVLGCSYYLNTGLWQFWSGGLSAKQWSHIVFSYDGTTARTWINNRLIKTETKSARLVPFLTSLYIGSRKGSEPFYGALDDIKVFRRALDAADVERLFTEKRAPDGVQLVLPADNAEMDDRRMLFRWTPVSNAARYRLQVARDVAFTSFVVDTIVAADSCSARIAGTDAVVYWRVQAMNTFGTSGMSAMRTVRLKASTVDEQSVAMSAENSCMTVTSTDGELVIDLSRCHDGSVQGEADVVLADITGREVYRGIAHGSCTEVRGNVDASLLRIPLPGIVRGMYLLRVGSHGASVRIR